MNKEEQKQHIIDLMNMGDYKQKTALQQLIDKFEEERLSGRNSKEVNIVLYWAEMEARGLLKTERRQIEDAFRYGIINENKINKTGYGITPADYYNETFKPE